ncbi:hypothetical protein [Streptomyces finlayi]|uniref:hypothetical protein n=1 Tax=Streptomyces finlayi TaxID=67296 RepID=UPI001623642F|nr:hypothetical protein [Streptomyces finlayi]
MGLCWRCDDADVAVMWLGPVQRQDHGHAPMHACEPCVQRLEVLVREYNAQR